MNEPVPAEFHQAYVDHWREWQLQPWGRLLYSTSHLNLSRHLPDRPLRVLDVGGGNGTDSLHFAAEGHTVTLLDSSEAMLAEAQARAEAGGLRRATDFL